MVALYPKTQTVSYRFLQQALQLDDDPMKPLVVAITRLVPQKASPQFKTPLTRLDPDSLPPSVVEPGLLHSKNAYAVLTEHIQG